MANNSTLKKIQIDNVTYDIGGGASVAVQNNTALVINNSGTDTTEIANTIAANPSAEATESLNKIKIGDVVYTIEGSGSSADNSIQPIYKEMIETEDGFPQIVFTEEELTQIKNNLGTVVNMDAGGMYLPLVPAYSKLNMDTGTPDLILCCQVFSEAAGMSMWYKFKATDNPLIFALDLSDVSSPFAENANTNHDLGVQFITCDLSDINPTEKEFLPINTVFGLLETNPMGEYDNRPLVLFNGDSATIEELTEMMKVYGWQVLTDNENLSIANFSCRIEIPGSYDTIQLPSVMTSSELDDETLKEGIIHGEYTIDPFGMTVSNTDIPVLIYKGSYGEVEYIIEARPLYHKWQSGTSNFSSQTSLYALILTKINSSNGSNNTYYFTGDPTTSVEDFNNIVAGDYSHVDLNGSAWTIMYKDANSLIAETVAGILAPNTTYGTVLKAYSYWKKNNNALSFQTIHSYNPNLLVVNDPTEIEGLINTHVPLPGLVIGDTHYDVGVATDRIWEMIDSAIGEALQGDY